MQDEGGQNNTYTKGLEKPANKTFRCPLIKNILLFHFQTGAKMYPGPEIQQHAHTHSQTCISLKQNILL